MSVDWFKPRAYRHFDVPVDPRYAARVSATGFAASHSFSPLLHFTKSVKRYRPKASPGKVEVKDRPIMYASHRDACVYSCFSAALGKRLEAWYTLEGLGGNAIAYRRLGRANYHFAAEVAEFARQHAPCYVLAFDVTQFFDTLDHSRLKERLRTVLGVPKLSDDWFAVLRNITRYSYVDMADLKAHPVIGPTLDDPPPHPLIDIRRVKAEGVTIHKNLHSHGIPQGSPISSTLANLYMTAFDKTVAAWCRDHGALYRRYSDDILVVCKPNDVAEAERAVMKAIVAEKLAINPAKTERTEIRNGSSKAAQYLGFSIHYDGASIRPSSMSRQWRKLKRTARRIEEAGRAAIASGKASKIYTKKLRKRFSALRLRNFSSYARRSGKSFESRTIRRQALKMEREIDRIIRSFP